MVAAGGDGDSKDSDTSLPDLKPAVATSSTRGRIEFSTPSTATAGAVAPAPIPTSPPQPSPTREFQATRFEDGLVVFRLDGGPSEFDEQTRGDVFGVRPAWMGDRAKPVRTLSGRVVDAHGDPIAGAAVVGSKMPAVMPGPTTGAGEFGGRAGTLSDSSGRFSFEVPAHGVTLVARSRDHGWSEPLSIPAGADGMKELELVLEGMATLSGTFTIEGAAAQGTVSVLRRDDTTRVLARARIDDEGTYALELPEGAYAVRAQESLGAGWTEGETGRRRTVDLDLHAGDEITQNFLFKAGLTVEVRSKPGGAKVSYYLAEDHVESYEELSEMIRDPLVTVLNAAPMPDDDERFAVFEGVEHTTFSVCATSFNFGNPTSTVWDCKRISVEDGQTSYAVLFDPL